jgi:hypothetical protein
MVVVERHVRGSAIGPTEDNPPLIVDADTVPSFSVPLQHLQPISGRYAQIFQDLGCIQHVELPVDSRSKPWRDPHRSPLATAVEKVRRNSISERNDHPAVSILHDYPASV